MNYLISYPRSGNTMARYIFELITQKPSNGLCGKPNPNDKLQKPLIHSGVDYCLYKRHDFKCVHETDFVFFIIRDYLEAIIRHNEKPRGIELDKMYKYVDSWFDLLRQFDQFEGNKMCLYYDELLKFSFDESKKIYPDAQSNHKDFHKNKLSKQQIFLLDEYAKNIYPELYKKYVK